LYLFKQLEQHPKGCSRWHLGAAGLVAPLLHGVREEMLRSQDGSLGTQRGWTRTGGISLCKNRARLPDFPPSFVRFSNVPKTLKGSVGTFHPVGAAGRSIAPDPSHCTVSVRPMGCWLSPQYMISEASSDSRTKKNSGEKALCHSSWH